MHQTKISSWASRALATLALSLVTLSAAAGPVTWSAGGAISGDTDVRTNGTLVMAYNLGSAQAVTVNGVSFLGFFVGAAPAHPADHVHTEGNATLTLRSRERAENVLENRGRFTNQGPFALLSGDYQTLLRDSAGNNFPDRFDNPAVLTLAGLVIGQVYEFQAWFNDSKESGCCDYGLSLWDAADPTNLVELSANLLRDVNGDVVEGGLGEHVLATFTADSSTQSFAYMRTETSGGLNGFQLRQRAAMSTVPTPGSLPLLVAALLALGVTCRTRRC